MSDTPSLSAQDALMAVMIAVSAADAQLRTAEMVAIQRIVNHMPVFADYDPDRTRPAAATIKQLRRDVGDLACALLARGL